MLNEEELKKVENLIKEKKLIEKNSKIYSTNFLLADAITSYILE